MPENGGGGVTLALVSRRLNFKSDLGAMTETKRKIEITPFFSVELAKKLACCR